MGGAMTLNTISVVSRAAAGRKATDPKPNCPDRIVWRPLRTSTLHNEPGL
jgi:hypothetical protein